MRLDALLRAHGLMRVERPPQLWETDTDEERFIPLLGEMIAASLARGGKLEELTLNVANVTVPPPEPGDTGGPAAGDYVAVTVRGEVAWEADATWTPGRPWTLPWLDDLTLRLAPAGVRFGYTRDLPPGGSITVFLPRLVVLPNAGPGADSGSGAAAPRRARRA
jgi:hypothetical protein